MERKRFIGLASLALAVSGVVAGCEGNFPGGNAISQELNSGNASDGRKFTTLVIEGQNHDYQLELIANKGVNVRTVDPSIEYGIEVGRIPMDATVENAETFNTDRGQWAAIKCSNPAIVREEYAPFMPNLDSLVCYLASGEFAKEVSAASK